MSKSGNKAIGCLWLFIETICIVVCIVLLILKLCSIPIKWITVFSPLIIGVAISVAILLVVFIVNFTEKGE